MKTFKSVALVLALVLGVILLTETAHAAWEMQSLGIRTPNTRKAHLKWRVDRDIYGYKVVVKSGKLIINTIQFTSGGPYKEFTYAQYYNAGEVIENTFEPPIRVVEIKVNTDANKGSSVELFIVTGKKKKAERRVGGLAGGGVGGFLGGTGAGGFLGGGAPNRGGPRYGAPAGVITSGGSNVLPHPGSERTATGAWNMGTILPARRSQTVIWGVGDRVSRFEVQVDRGRARVHTIRLFSGNAVVAEYTYGINIDAGKMIREDIQGSSYVSRIEMDVTDNVNSAFTLGIRN